MGLYGFFRGYMKVALKGNRCERFINIVTHKKVYIWNVCKREEGTLEFCVSKRGYDVIKKTAEENGLDCTITGEYGFLTELKKLKKRWMFAVFIPLSAVVVFLLSSVIWEIEITKADYVDEIKVRETLYKLGIREGRIKYNIDYRNVQNTILREYDEYIWANVELQGAKLVVTLEPRKKAPEFIDKDTPCNIVAKKDGYILSVIAQNGEKVVEPGDTVFKGQTLISGIVQSKKVGAIYVHSLGEVKARTWTEKIKKQKLYKYDKTYTGNINNSYEINIFGLKIPIYFKKNIDFYNYDSIIKESNIFFINFKEYVNQEYTVKKVKLSVDEAVEICSEELMKEIEKETQNITSKKVTYKTIDDETIEVRVFVSSEEDITQSEKIVTDKTIDAGN